MRWLVYLQVVGIIVVGFVSRNEMTSDEQVRRLVYWLMPFFHLFAIAGLCCFPVAMLALIVRSNIGQERRLVYVLLQVCLTATTLLALLPAVQ